MMAADSIQIGIHGIILYFSCVFVLVFLCFCCFCCFSSGMIDTHCCFSNAIKPLFFFFNCQAFLLLFQQQKLLGVMLLSQQHYVTVNMSYCCFSNDKLCDLSCCACGVSCHNFFFFQMDFEIFLGWRCSFFCNKTKLVANHNTNKNMNWLVFVLYYQWYVILWSVFSCVLYCMMFVCTVWLHFAYVFIIFQHPIFHNRIF